MAGRQSTRVVIVFSYDHVVVVVVKNTFWDSLKQLYAIELLF